MATTTYPIPTDEELASIWENRSIFPMKADKRHYMARELFAHLGLDWRVPEERAHVYSIVDRHIEPASRQDWETND